MAASFVRIYFLTRSLSVDQYEDFTCKYLGYIKVVRPFTRHRFGHDSDRGTYSFKTDTIETEPLIFSLLEPDLAIICVCLTAMQPLFSRFRRKWPNESQSSGGTYAKSMMRSRGLTSFLTRSNKRCSAASWPSRAQSCPYSAGSGNVVIAMEEFELLNAGIKPSEGDWRNQVIRHPPIAKVDERNRPTSTNYEAYL